MNAIIQIIQHTPIWVFPLIVAVLWFGSMHLRERTVHLRSLFVIPLVMLVLSIGNSAGTCAEPSLALIVWFFSAAIGAVIGWSLTPKPLAIHPKSRLIILPGSTIPLIVFAGIIMLRYAFGYLYGRYPELLADRTYALALIAGGALLGGVMLGRCGRFGLWYWRAASSETAAQTSFEQS